MKHIKAKELFHIKDKLRTTKFNDPVLQGDLRNATKDTGTTKQIWMIKSIPFPEFGNFTLVI